MATHQAIGAVKPRALLETFQRQTVNPGPGQVLVKSEWTASTPLDLHQADGGLGISEWPHVLGDNTAGTVVKVGDGVEHLAVGDKVFGFVWRSNQERPYQTFLTTDAYLLGKIPANLTMQQAATVPDNLVTTFHSLRTELGIELPWPKSDSAAVSGAEKPFLIWGGSSSVGQYAIQILKYYGFTNILATASKRHHESLKQLGASQVFDYNDKDIAQHISAAVGPEQIPYILDCIGSLHGSVAPISRIAKRGTKSAILLPVIVKDSTVESEPIYAFDVKADTAWAEGVEAIGVRTHFYLQNELYKEKLQPEIVPKLLAEGVVKPNKFRYVEGRTMLERAQKALDALRNKEASGERLVWRVADE